MARDRYIGLFFIVLGVAYAAYAMVEYPLYLRDRPGPGYFPLMVGAGTVLFATLVFLKPDLTTISSFRFRELGSIAKICVPGFLWLFLLPRANNFLATTFVSLVLITKLLGVHGWVRPLAFSAATALVCQWLFVNTLRVPF